MDTEVLAPPPVTEGPPPCPTCQRTAPVRAVFRKDVYPHEFHCLDCDKGFDA